MLTYRSNTAQVTEALRASGARAKDVRPVLTAFGSRMREHSIPQNFRVGGRPSRWPSSARGGQTMVDTARLLRSIQDEVSGGTMRVGTNLRYAAQRHFGGKLTPKAKKWLAVPVKPGMRRSPSQVAGLRWAPVRKPGNVGGRLVRPVGRKGARKWETVFLLVKEVDQPARPFLLFQDEDIAWAERELVQHVLAPFGGGAR